MKFFKYFFVGMIMWSICSAASGQSLEEARTLYKAGKYKEALPAFESLIKKQPSNSSINQWYGVCLYETGRYADSEKYLKFAASRNIQEAFRYLADLYAQEYRFADAVANYTKYIASLKKSKVSTEAAEKLLAKAQMGEQMLKGVEEVQVIDSLIVDKKSFFDHYKLSPESGTLHPYNRFFSKTGDNNGLVYQTQREDKIFYGSNTTKNGYDLFLRNKLSGNNWSEEIALPDNINFGADQNYPYLLSDGVTLYFASNGESSLGGYDIFVTRLNLNTGNYLNPENVGMPFNSPYNDYLLAIDEVNNIGWFVTDRFQPEGKALVYVFIPNAEKKVYTGDDPQRLRDLARITSIRQTWPKGANYDDLLHRIYNSDLYTKVEKKGDFIFPVNDNITYTTLPEFSSNEARNFYVKASEIRKEISRIETTLSAKRKEYAEMKGNKAGISDEIRKMEERLLPLYGQPEELDNRSRNAEITFLKKQQK